MSRAPREWPSAVCPPPPLCDVWVTVTVPGARSLGGELIAQPRAPHQAAAGSPWREGGPRLRGAGVVSGEPACTRPRTARSRPCLRPDDLRGAGRVLGLAVEGAAVRRRQPCVRLLGGLPGRRLRRVGHRQPGGNRKPLSKGDVPRPPRPLGAERPGGRGGGASACLRSDPTWFPRGGRPPLAPARWPWGPGDLRTCASSHGAGRQPRTSPAVPEDSGLCEHRLPCTLSTGVITIACAFPTCHMAADASPAGDTHTRTHART